MTILFILNLTHLSLLLEDLACAPCVSIMAALDAAVHSDSSVMLPLKVRFISYGFEITWELWLILLLFFLKYRFIYIDLVLYTIYCSSGNFHYNGVGEGKWKEHQYTERVLSYVSGPESTCVAFEKASYLSTLF